MENVPLRLKTLSPEEGIGRKEEGIGRKVSLDKEKNCDKISLLNALMEQSAGGGSQREGMVEALGHTAAQATPKRPGRTGTAHPRYPG